MPKVPVKVVSWDDIVDMARRLADVISSEGYTPDVVIAVARGGYVPARLICDLLGVENLISIQSQHWTEAAKAAEKAILKYAYVVDLSGQRALLVDDIIDTGDSVKLACDYIRESWKPKELKVAALQWISPIAKIKPDFYAVEVKDWVWFQYPWTALEDVIQFILRIIREEKLTEFSFGEIVEKMGEWYGEELVEKRSGYIIRAIRNLVRKGRLAVRDGKYVVVG